MKFSTLDNMCLGLVLALAWAALLACVIGSGRHQNRFGSAPCIPEMVDWGVANGKGKM